MRELVPQEGSHEIEGPVNHLDEQLVCWEKRECFFRQDQKSRLVFCYFNKMIREGLKLKTEGWYGFMLG